MSSAIKIRRARLSDIDCLMGLEERGFSSDRFSRNQFRYLISRARATVLVVELEKRLVGQATLLWRRNIQSVRLYNIVVDPAMQGKGIGRKLMEMVEKEARKNKCLRINLEVRADNESAIGLYEKYGYYCLREVPDYYSDGMAAIKMRKDLTQKSAIVL